MRFAALAVIAFALAVGCKVDGATDGSGSASAPPAAPAPPAAAPSSARTPANGSSAASAAPTQLAPGSDRPAALDHFARERRLRALDTDGDGVISDAERAAARRQRVDTIRAKLDTNGDGVLTIDELSASKVYTFDPATVDVNHDGNISSDELDPIVVQHFRRMER